MSKRVESAPKVELDDRLVRSFAVPAFGVVVPRVSGLLDGIPTSSPLYWLGSAWAVLAVAAVSHGTRGTYLAQRCHGTWTDQPFRKLTKLVGKLLSFTVPPTLLALAGWNALLGTAAWRPALVTLAMAVLGVVLMVYLYEFAFLLKERAAERSRLLGLDRARAEAELAAARAHVDPHFLFNSLNTLGHLIATDPHRAREFNAHLAQLHCYVAGSAIRPLIALEEELAFLSDYVALMKIRFGPAFEVEITGSGSDPRSLLPPTALQVLVENAIKHNELAESRPLVVTVTLLRDAVVVFNERRPCRLVRPTAGGGLRNLDERLQRTSGARLCVEQRPSTFSVAVPLATPPAGRAVSAGASAAARRPFAAWLGVHARGAASRVVGLHDERASFEHP